MASRAMGYSDYYKNNSNVPGSNTDPNLTKKAQTEEDEITKKRKAAVQRRLRMRKAGN